ncbi:MAG TPA: acyl-CoA dehydrogenase family protein [Actinomycetota bacterium]|jgi:alkylation response protein AidB-like acyl-CoA dehydrogenase|nr:acyl-CoA dehydrogenase family protein [Actinomycetota bacterium]
MRFDFDETQYALRDLARDLFEKESPPSRLRGLLDGKPFDRGVWKTMAEAGITGITVPESYGGAGGNELDLALVYEEAGKAALPEPLLETVGIAAPLIAEHGSDHQRDRWLPAIASGDAIVAVDGGPYTNEADATLTIGEDVRLDGESLGDVHVAAYERAFFGTASLLNGVAAQLLRMTLEHVKDREQFGKPVGSFQAVKHKLASMHVAIESSRPATWYAAYAIANGLEQAGIAACVAKIAANDTEALCNREALQCHGGIGFTWEHDLHFWLKRGMALRTSFGSSVALRRRLLDVHTIEELP